MLPREHFLKQPFDDREHFPDGLARSGQFSPSQARLIRRHGTLIRALARGEVTNPTDADRQLLRVIAREAPPRQPVELAWLKYLGLIGERAPRLRRSA